MFMEAAQAVAHQVPDDLLQQGLFFPLQSSILEAETQTPRAWRSCCLIRDFPVFRVRPMR